MSLFSKKTLPSTDPAGTAYPVAKTDEDWRAELSAAEFHDQDSDHDPQVVRLRI